MKGYSQMVESLINDYDLSVHDAMKLVDRCLFDYDVIVAIRKRAEELQSEEPFLDSY